MDVAIKIIGIFFILIAIALAYRGPAPRATADTLSGIYTNEHQITVPSEDINAPDATELMEPTSDRLTLEKQKDGTLKFHAELVFSYYHVCEMDAIAKPVDGGYEYIQPENQIITQRCKLKINVDDDAITFADPRNTCNDTCGARGYYDQISFKRSTRSPLAPASGEPGR